MPVKEQHSSSVGVSSAILVMSELTNQQTGYSGGQAVKEREAKTAAALDSVRKCLCILSF